MFEALETRLRRYEELERLITDPKVISDSSSYQKLTKELASLRGIVSKYREYKKAGSEVDELEGVLAKKSDDADFAELAKEELLGLRKKMPALEKEIEEMLLEDDPDADKNIIVEIRAGTGGQEASLFASDLFRMYSKYAAGLGWSVEMLGSSISEAGGFKEVVFGINGNGVYRKMKFESGVHRVQRVPATEASGRIHTSTVSVAVLPEAEDVDIKIDAKDLKIDVFRSSGAGGQSVNTADSAVRITHVPTGIVVQCQDERSQLKNKNKAMKVLRARLLDKAVSEQHAKIAKERKTQIGTGERSEKIRTYNYPDRRVTDHRIGLTVHNLENVLEGDLEEIIMELLKQEKDMKLKEAK
ncbi:MAG TPA: peptide chain release factor 1 [Candidatus Omnitrophota bacterium]|nr:peptide chain release factor 1 [Candidatus Omnitrophota bacterium]HPN66579.1 peptide chain release factor 1 [Candidatus Omnitrophota bacterium]